jgi:integrase
MGIKKEGQNLYRIDAHVVRNGKEYRRRELFNGTKAKTEEKYLQLKKELRDGGNACSLTVAETFGEALRFYLDRNDAGKSMTYFKRLLADLGEVSISLLGERFDKYRQLLKSSIGQRTGKPISNGTINRYLTWAAAALNFAVRHGVIKENPLKHFQKLKEIPRDVILSDMDKRHLLNVIDREAHHLGAVVRFALQVPCRKSELVNMKKEDLDLFNNVIRVHNGETKNGAGIWKPIPPDMKEYFRAIPAGCQYLFYRQDKNGYHGLGDFKKAWKHCLKIAGVNDFRFHDTRHCSASALIDNGTPEQVVMSIAGWKTNMLRIYYNREPKKTLELVRFSPEHGHFMDTPKAEAL